MAVPAWQALPIRTLYLRKTPVLGRASWNIPLDFYPGSFGNPDNLDFYDEFDLEEIDDRPGPGTSSFCIDVDETHNFVTTGGVVHNCRPPQNRDPQPDEIAACRPWLDAQIRLVDPKVVVTLGNFAAKTLLETTTGITRLRGQTYPFQGRILLPTFHPAAARQNSSSTVTCSTSPTAFASRPTSACFMSTTPCRR